VFDLQSDPMTMIGKLTEKKIPNYFNIDILTGRELIEAHGTASIRFLPDGSSVGGEVIVNSHDGDHVKVRINWLTGLSSISR
ncbi:MAG: hypothetical protein AAGD96_30135, partial [Chloroflexota bacterium]